MGFQLPASKANLNDICPSYVAHAMSIANTLASVTGFVSPAIAGELLDTYGNNHTSWGIIWSISGKNSLIRVRPPQDVEKTDVHDDFRSGNQGFKGPGRRGRRRAKEL